MTFSPTNYYARGTEVEQQSMSGFTTKRSPEISKGAFRDIGQRR